MTKWDDEGNPWTIKSVQRVFENDWFALDDHDVTRPDGAPGRYTVIRPRRLAVGVVPIEPDGTVHLVGQWRFPLGAYSWEIPEGGAEPGEAAEACAHRELEEETGFKAGRLEKILEIDLSNSLTDERCVLFVAFDLTPGAANPEPVEVLQRRSAPFQEVLAKIASGKIRDSLTVAALLRLHHMAVIGELPRGLADAILMSRAT